jgi:hypothetical protein
LGLLNKVKSPVSQLADKAFPFVAEGDEISNLDLIRDIGMIIKLEETLSIFLLSTDLIPEGGMLCI